VLPQTEDAPEAFSSEELVQVRARRIETDLLQAAGFAWPAERRFKTMLPVVVREKVPPRVVPGEHLVAGVRVIVH
jgi:hypothetical protein